jgi:hypothetical protein
VVTGLVLLGSVGLFAWRAYADRVAKVQDAEVAARNATDLAKLRGDVDRWQDAVKVAASTSRIALPGPVATLQSIRRETASLSLEGCPSRAREKLIEHMDRTIDSMLAFMRNNESESTRLTNEAGDLAGEAAAYLQACDHLQSKSASNTK